MSPGSNPASPPQPQPMTPFSFTTPISLDQYLAATCHHCSSPFKYNTDCMEYGEGSLHCIHCEISFEFEWSQDTFSLQFITINTNTYIITIDKDNTALDKKLNQSILFNPEPMDYLDIDWFYSCTIPEIHATLNKLIMLS